MSSRHLPSLRDGPRTAANTTTTDAFTSTASKTTHGAQTFAGCPTDNHALLDVTGTPRVETGDAAALRDVLRRCEQRERATDDRRREGHQLGASVWSIPFCPDVMVRAVSSER